MANGIKIGNLDISYFKVGSSDCKVYLGDTLLYPSTQVKFKATYAGGITYSAECDSNATLTSATTKPSDYQYTAMTTAEIGDCITSIGGSAFQSCYSLTSINIPTGVTNIGDRAFQVCSGLTSIDIPDGVTNTGQHTFNQCTNLATINFSPTSRLTTIGYASFANNPAMVHFDIPTTVTSIGGRAFRNNTSLEEIVIPSGVTSIDAYAFDGCSSLTSVTVNAATPPTLANVNAFTNTNNCLIYVPASSVETYKSASVWSTYADRIQAIPS